MRAHGVPNFPDPSSADGGVQLSGSGINTQSPAFQAAQSACQKLLPGGLPVRGGGSATRIEQGVKIAECMRANGMRTFPDPTTSPPSTLPAPDAVFLGGPDGAFSLTASMVQSPAFKQAAATCGFPFPASGRGFTMRWRRPAGEARARARGSGPKRSRDRVEWVERDRQSLKHAPWVPNVVQDAAADAKLAMISVWTEMPLRGR
jgi:hypothetical protein